ncbi:MAG: tetratricopeptide repeat protein [Planctomycetota bacterium]
MSEDAPQTPETPADPPADSGGGSLFPVVVLLALCGAAVIALLSLGGGESAPRRVDPETAKQIEELSGEAERLLLEERNPTEALVYLERGLGLDADDVHLNVLAGAALISLGNTEQALEYLNHAYDLAPDDPSVLRHRALALQSLQRWTEARPLWQQLLKLAEAEPDGDPSGAHLQLATNFMFAGELEPAVSHLEAYLERHEDNALAFQMYADALGGLGRRDASLAAMERVVALAPKSLPTHHALQAKKIAYRGFDAVLADARERAAAENAGALEHYLYARLLARVPGETERARQEYVLALELDPALYWALEGLAQIDLRQGRPADARDHAQRGLELAKTHDDDFPQGVVRLAAAERKLGDYAAALEHLQPLLNRDGYTFTAAIEYLGCLLDSGRLDDALAFTQAQTAGKPADAQQSILLAVAHHARKEPEQQRAVLEAAVAAQPESSGWRFQLALVDLEQGRMDEARAGFAKVFAEHPQDRPMVPYLAFWGGYVLAESDPEGARARWKLGRGRPRVWPDAFWGDACGRALGEVDAETLAESAELEGEGERNHGPFVEGFVRERAGELDEARALYEQVLERARHGGEEWPAGLARARLAALNKD